MGKKINIFITILLIFCNSYSQVENIHDWLGEWKTTFINNLNEQTEDFLIIELIHLDRWIHFIDSGTVFSKPELK